MSKKSRNTKTKIVSAAWELFYLHGYDDTTVDEIVEASGTSKGSFYHYFNSKDALLDSLAYLLDEKYEELAEHLPENADAFDILLLLNRELFDLIDNKIDQKLLAKLYSAQLVRKGEKSLLDNDRMYYKLLRQVVQKGQETGELTKAMSVNEIVRLYAMCERAMIFEWCICNYSFSLKAYAQVNLPMLLSGIKNASWLSPDKNSG